MSQTHWQRDVLAVDNYIKVHKTKQLLENSNFNPLMATLKPQSSGPLCSNTVIGTLAVDGWAEWLRPRPVASSLYQM